jgi:GAF domain-containing protein
LGVHATVFIVLLTVVVLIGRYLAHAYDQVTNAQQARMAMRLHAYAHLDRLVIQDVRRITVSPANSQDFAERFVSSKGALQELVEAAYSAFEAGYGKSAQTEERIDFEVTFMTKSYQDGHITIPAYANRDGRAPRSMVLRQQRLDIYEGTVTAAVYREARPSIHIIENTASPQAQYQELYPDQTKRIRSSIVYPVLSCMNELLGTLVVHCDRTGFFNYVDEKYWTDLLEVFAKRLALVKLKLDKLIAISAPVPVGRPPLPF